MSIEENPFISKKYLINNISKEERQSLQHSLLGKTVKILIIDGYGLYTEHGFPVAISYFTGKDPRKISKEFNAKVIKTIPMVTIDDFPNY